MIDLHLHSSCSDGTLSPRELIALCASRGLTTVAVADHDTIDGVREAVEAGRDLGVEVIPAVEMSAGNELEIHILGYFIDIDDERTLGWLHELREGRVLRVARMVARLREIGMAIDLSDVEAQAEGTSSIGRMHLAKALVALGYAQDTGAAFANYLVAGKPGYIRRDNLQAGDLIRQMETLGMVTSLAHGAKIDLPAGQLLSLFSHMVACGLCGAECYHGSYTPMMERLMLSQAKARKLLITGGSDFHGENRRGIMPGDGLANWHDAAACLERLKEAKGNGTGASGGPLF